jgi:pimeloyl-ACP methyl ester carboxylesterase
VQASAGGRLVGYEESGSGVPLLLLHAFPLSRRLWAPQLASLGGRAHCIAPDFRGFGDSPPQPPYTMDQYADDVVALLDALGVAEPVVVAGLSMGGYVAFALWRRHPDRIRALILADTRPTADTPEQATGRRETIENVRRGGSEAIAGELVPKMLSEHTLRRSPETGKQVAVMVAAQPAEGIIGATEAMLARPDSTPTLETITVPTLVIVGEDDRITPPDVAESMHRAIRGSRLERLRHAGHLSSLERPAAFNGVVAELLEGLG